VTDILTRLGDALQTRYRLDKEVGAGGMATVYLAHDLRHDRDVAIKVLHPDLAAALGAERFLAEIKTTAKLQHPHILPLLDSGEADGLLYYVMPFVAGESLRNRLDRETQLSVDDAIRIAREVASAIESAHKQGVVHRDIKPENILLHEDQALVADFGIALAVKAAGGARMTQTGLSLGTPQYMAPEQAMGERAIDGRADIYALGAVTYEMLVGEAPFTGPSVQAIVARVMTETPRPLTGQRRSVPANVNAAVLKALEKLPADRFSSAADFSRALVAPDFTVAHTSATAGDVSHHENASSKRLAVLPWTVAAIAAVAAIALAFRTFTSQPAAAPIHLAVDLPAGMELVPADNEVLSISDDGSTIAVGVVLDGKPQLFLRRLDSDSLHFVQGATNVNGSAAFSPDGNWLAFQSGGKIWKEPVTGGAPAEITPSVWGQITWLNNAAIAYTKDYDTGLFRIGSDGNDSATLTVPDKKKGELGHWWPQLLPDGDHLLFTNYVTPADKSTIEVLSLKSGKHQVVFRGAYFARYLDGHLLFTRNGVVMTVPFDANKLSTSGTPVQLPVEIETHASNGWAGFAISKTGTLVYREDVMKRVEAVWSDENGNEEPALDSAARVSDVVASPDNRKIGVVRDGDVWIYDRQRGVYTRLTQTEQVETRIVWTPDSKEVLYSRDVPQYNIFKRAADGSTPEELLVTSPRDKHPDAVTPDGKLVIYDGDNVDGSDIFIAPVDIADKTPPRLLIQGAGNQSEAALSPDGRWLTYTSAESGRTEVYLTSYPLDRGPARQQVSISGGDRSQWARDGHAIYYYSSSGILRVKIDPVTGNIGKAEPVTKVRPALGWSIAPDGRFLIRRIPKGGEHRSLKVILNWASTLNDLSRAPK
jgi:eukaryotic-like serine/threonine-protein kinase